MGAAKIFGGLDPKKAQERQDQRHKEVSDRLGRIEGALGLPLPGGPRPGGSGGSITGGGTRK